MRITKVYTRTGDTGKTSLIGGDRVKKDHIRVEATGTVDELNATVALAIQFVDNREIEQQLIVIQHDLFNVGANLTTPRKSRWSGMIVNTIEDVQRLESWIDKLNGELEPLREFILPGGGRGGSALHLCRTVCRRAERRVVTLIQQCPDTDLQTLAYLNRLSDYLFVCARFVAKVHKVPEVFWKNKSKKSTRERLSED